MDFLLGFTVGVVAVRLGKPIFAWFVRKEAQLIKEIEKDS
jgi:hypothetical protein